MVRAELAASIRPDRTVSIANGIAADPFDQPSTSGYGAADGSISLEFLQCDETKKRREVLLRQHAFFQLRINLISGHDLVPMDKNGTSDPYVKFKLGGRLLYKSRTVHRDLNPVWQEQFTVPIEDPFQPIHIKVFDYDWGLQDDFMGSAKLEMAQLELGLTQSVALKLEDPSRADQNLGELRLSVTLWPRTQEDKEQVCAAGTR